MLRLAGALWRFWWIRDQDIEARMWLEEANVNGKNGPAPLRAEVLRGLGGVVDGLGDPARGRELEEEALGLYREIGDQAGIGACLNNLGLFALERGDLERATSLLEDSIECQEQLDADASLPPRKNLAEVLVRKGEFAKARGLFQEVLAGAIRTNDALVVADVRLQLAWIACFEHSYEDAAQLVREALPTFVQIAASLDSALCMFVAALISAGRGRLDDAARLVGAASATRERLGRPPSWTGCTRARSRRSSNSWADSATCRPTARAPQRRSTTQSNSYRALSRFQVTELVDNLDGLTSVTCERDIDWDWGASTWRRTGLGRRAHEGRHRLVRLDRIEPNALPPLVFAE